MRLLLYISFYVGFLFNRHEIKICFIYNTDGRTDRRTDGVVVCEFARQDYTRPFTGMSKAVNQTNLLLLTPSFSKRDTKVATAALSDERSRLLQTPCLLPKPKIQVPKENVSLSLPLSFCLSSFHIPYRLRQSRGLLPCAYVQLGKFALTNLLFVCIHI